MLVVLRTPKARGFVDRNAEAYYFAHANKRGVGCLPPVRAAGQTAALIAFRGASFDRPLFFAERFPVIQKLPYGTADWRAAAADGFPQLAGTFRP